MMFRLLELIFDRRLDYYIDDAKREEIKSVLVSLLSELTEREEAILKYRFSLDTNDFHDLRDTAARYRVKEEDIENEINNAVIKLRHHNCINKLADLVLVKQNYKITINNPNGGEDVFWKGHVLFDEAHNKFYEAVIGQEHGERFRSVHMYRDDELLFSET